MSKTKNSSLENKKTTELIDLMEENVDDKGNISDDYNEIREILLSREPFYSLLHPRTATLAEEFDEIEDDIKKLKRHKHDEKNGDVLIRI